MISCLIFFAIPFPALAPMNSSSPARSQMTYQQVRAWSVLPPATLAVFEQLRREDFVPADWRGAAYGDFAIPLGGGQHMLTPTVAGRMLQTLAPARGDTILEIGTGSGYLTACLALLGASVHSLEIRPELARQARVNLKRAGIGNAEVEEGDAFNWQPAAPAYDVVAITGAMPVYDARFESLLKPGGRLFAVAGQAPVMEARLVRLTGGRQREETSLFETMIDPLEHAATVNGFVF
jgi:protein-L-isoaspartate(D-aspartate) O-methyltransferase